MARKRISLLTDELVEEKVVAPKAKPAKAKNKKTWEDRLTELLPSYRDNKTEMDAVKKIVDAANKEIKSIMLANAKDEFVVGDVKAKVSISERESFVEEALIAKLKALKVEGVIKQSEYVDMAMLEDAIYNGKLDAASLADCQEKKEVVTLRISTIKN